MFNGGPVVVVLTSTRHLLALGVLYIERSWLILHAALGLSPKLFIWRGIRVTFFVNPFLLLFPIFYTEVATFYFLIDFGHHPLQFRIIPRQRRTLFMGLTRHKWYAWGPPLLKRWAFDLLERRYGALVGELGAVAVWSLPELPPLAAVNALKDDVLVDWWSLQVYHGFCRQVFEELLVFLVHRLYVQHV